MEQKKFDYEPIIMTIGISGVSFLLEHFVFNDLIQQNQLNFLYIYGMMSIVAGAYTFVRGKEKDIDLHVWVIVTVLFPISVFTLIWADPKEMPEQHPEKDDDELMNLIDKLNDK